MISLIKYLILGIIISSTTSCDKQAKITTKSIKAKQTEAATEKTGKLALSVNIVDDMRVALKANGMTNQEANVITQGALAGLNNIGTLALQGDPYSLHLAVPRLTGAAIKTMADPNANLADSQRKLEISGVMTSSVFGSLKDKMEFMDETEKAELPGGVAKSAVSNLAEAGLDKKDLADGIGKIVDSTVSNLDNAGYNTGDMQNLVVKISKNTVEGMKSLGIEKTQVDSAMQSFVKATVGALGNAGIKAADVGGFVGPIMSEAVGGLDDLGLKGASQMQAVVGNLMSKTVQALSSAGVKDTKDVASVLNQSVKGAMEGVSNAGIGANDLTHFVDDMMKGAISSLDDMGIKDAAAISSLSSTIAADTIGYLDDFGVKDKDAIKEASQAVATGTMSALGDLKDTGIIDGAVVESASAAVSREAVDAIFRQAESLGFSDEITDVASGFTTGMVAGLAEAGWKTTEIAGITDDISAGFQDALKDEAAIDQGQLEAMTNTIEASSTSWIEELRIHCQKDKGIWHAEEGWCEYPQLQPAEGAKLPTPEEEESCFNDGGSILFKADGSWFCDLSIGGGLETEETCKASGYQWLQGPDGTYCETDAPPSACWSYLTEGACVGDGACTWVEDYCEADTLVLCSSYEVEANCVTRPGCIWEPLKEACITDPCISNPELDFCAPPTDEVAPVAVDEEGGGDAGGGDEGGADAAAAAEDALDGPVAIQTGAPTGTSLDIDVDIDIGGVDVVAYRYRISDQTDPDCSDDTLYSAEYPVATPIIEDISDRADGIIDLCVLARDADGNWTDPIHATIASWTKISSFISVGYDHSCAITTSGALFCWGSNTAGQLGVGGGANREKPVVVDETNLGGSEEFEKVTLGYKHTCGITNTGTTLCWGSGTNDQLMISGTNSTNIPALTTGVLPGGQTFVTVQAGQFHNCGITDQGNTYCWGNNPYSESGDGGSNSQSHVTPVSVNTNNLAVSEEFTTLSMGNHHSCGITDLGETYCWGNNNYGQIGEGGYNLVNHPTSVNNSYLGNQKLKTISLGSNHSCGVTDQGKVFCWGRNWERQLGYSGTNSSAYPKEIDQGDVPGGETFIAVASGGSHSCGISELGDMYCWGANTYGQIGNGTMTTYEAAPRLVSDANLIGEKFVSLSLGTNHSCGMTTSGRIYCWGSNDLGKLGINNMGTNNTVIPTAIDDTDF